MDPRVREHAEILVDWSIDLEEGENIVISASPEAHKLVVALNEEIGKRGAYPITLYNSSEADRAYIKSFDGELKTPEHVFEMAKKADAMIGIKSSTNLKSMSDVSGEKLAKFSRAQQPIQETFLGDEDKEWVGTQHPTNAQAQEAEMPLTEYEDFVYDAILRDWEEVEEKQEELKKRLDEASEVYIEGPGTEIEMSVDGMKAVNSAGRNNMPSGEVFTAPVVDSVEGDVYFDKPLIFQGREIEGVRLTFVEGEVVEYSAESNEERLDALFETDEGARRLGELGIGTNRGIDRFTYNMLFDEKMGDTIHMALGRAYDENVGEDREQNKSAVHVDMIKDMSEGMIKFDGEIIQENGKFVWED